MSETVQVSSKVIQKLLFEYKLAPQLMSHFPRLYEPLHFILLR
jgi:hypothetical protein